MLSDPDTARFITADGKPVTDALNGWRNAAIMSGHWVLHGVGMFVVEEKSIGTVRRPRRPVVSAGLAGL